MARGILSGITLGAVFSLGVAGILSFLLPIQPQSAPEVTSEPAIVQQEASAAQPSVVAPTGTVPQTGAQPQITLRSPTGETLPMAPDVAAPVPDVTTAMTAAPTSDPVVSGPQIATPTAEPEAPDASVPTLDMAQTGQESLETPAEPTANGPQPQVGLAGNLTQPQPLPDAVTARADADAPVLPNPQALAPMIPDESPDPQIEAQAPPAPTPPAAGAPSAQVAETVQQAETAPSVSAEPLETAQSDTLQPLSEEGGGASAETGQVSSLEQFAQGENAGDAPEPPVVAQIVRPRILPAPGTGSTLPGTSARPRIGTPASTLGTATEAETETLAQTKIVSAPVDPALLPPVQRYAQPFENPENKPLMSIVLLDSGADLQADAIGLPALSSFPYPVSFAVDVRLPDAAERMARYRAEGFDVLAVVNLPEAARPTDAEVSLSVTLNALPEVVGVMEGLEGGLQPSRDVADQVTGILLASGHGLVTQSKGLNSMPKLAVKEGVPAAPVFRDFDSEGQSARVIRRFLDQAAFKASQEGGVIMLGRLRPQTIEALLVWGLADRAGSVALAPVSAVLLAQK